MKRDNLSVFIVDDAPSVVEWLVDNVEWETYNCTIAGYTSEATSVMQFLKEHPVDLLLTDIMMPGMSGLHLIKKVKEKFPDIFVIVISAYDNFQYVKDAFQYGIVDYCLKPIDIDELHTCLKTVEGAWRERLIDNKNTDNIIFQNSIFQRLINGEDNASKLEEQCELAGIDLNVPVCQVVLLETNRLKKNKYISVINRIHRKEWRGIYCFLDDRMNLVLLCMGEKVCNRAMEKELRFILQTEDLADTLICVGNQLKNYRQITTSYQICNDFLNAGFLFRENILRVESYPYEKYICFLKNKKLNQLVYFLKVGRHDDVIQMIRRYVEGYGTEKQKKDELVCIAVFLIKNMRTIYPYQNEYVLLKELNYQVSSEEMLLWVVDFYRGIVRDAGDDNKCFHPHVKRALWEVSNHYADSSLSLQEIAKVCHISPAYLGKLFKDQTDEYFNEYLLKQRLKAAEVLLYENNLRIREIADKVGISSQSYFNRMFRRVYGISPVEYRRRCHDEE